MFSDNSVCLLCISFHQYLLLKIFFFFYVIVICRTCVYTFDHMRIFLSLFIFPVFFPFIFIFFNFYFYASTHFSLKSVCNLHLIIDDNNDVVNIAVVRCTVDRVISTVSDCGRVGGCRGRRGSGGCGCGNYDGGDGCDLGGAYVGGCGCDGSDACDGAAG